LDEFEARLDAGDWSEAQWQQFFDRHQWVFGYGLDYRIMRQFGREMMVGGAGTDNQNKPIVDFLYTFTDYTVLVEIKRHGLLTRHERLLRLEKATAERTIELTEEQVEALERFSPEFRARHIEAPHTGSLVAVDTFFVGTLKGVGKVWMQTAIDCHSRHAWARLYPSKLPVTAVHVLNNDVIPSFEAHGARIDAVHSDNGWEYCGCPDRHPYEFFLQLKEIEHRTTRVKRPQSNGIAERFHRTALDEHFRVEGCRPPSINGSSATTSGAPTRAAT
jgi:transposase InsO family protein